MKKYCLFLMLLLCISTAAMAENTIGASIQIRASRDVRDSVIRTGEDVDINVTFSGFEPVRCQWYFNGTLMQDETRRWLHIDQAQDADTGVYRMDAIDENGRVRLSVDTSLRVVNVTEIPKTGDHRMPQQVWLAGLAASITAMCLLIKMRKGFTK